MKADQTQTQAESNRSTANSTNQNPKPHCGETRLLLHDRGCEAPERERMIGRTNNRAERGPRRWVRLAGAVALGVALASMIAGCQALSYRDPSGAKFTRWSVGNKTTISELRVEADGTNGTNGTNGGKRLFMRGYVNDQAQAAASVTEAAVKAALSSQGVPSNPTNPTK